MNGISINDSSPAEQLRLLLKALSYFEEQELDTITSCFRQQTVKRNTILLHAGEVCDQFYFVHTGCIRMYFIDRKGQEKTRYVMLDCSIGTALSSFINQKPSAESVQALDDTVVLAISHTDFFRLNEQMKNWSVFYRKMLEMAYSFQNSKIEQLITLTAAQRYEKVLKETPMLIQRLSNRMLASYLDMREETLSRLKSS